jgi:hypothetical protein
MSRETCSTAVQCATKPEGVSLVDKGMREGRTDLRVSLVVTVRCSAVCALIDPLLTNAALVLW